MLQVRLNGCLVDFRIQYLTQVSNGMFFGVEQDWFGSTIHRWKVDEFIG